MANIDQVIEIMSEIAPAELAEDWDNVGVQVGDTSKNVDNVLLALDLNKEVIKEAEQKNCQLIITHHPLIFKGINSVNTQNETGRLIMELIKKDITLFSAHTNLDTADGGLNDYLAEMLDLKKLDKLSINMIKEFYKLVVFVPEDHLENIKKVLYKNDAGRLGSYSHSGFSVKGKGTFKPLSDSDPFIGEKDKVNEVKEYRLETIVPAEKADKIAAEVIKQHPYEEPAWDLYKLENIKKEFGLGRIGFLKEKQTLAQLLLKIKEVFSLPNFRYVGNKNTEIKKVALCSGSGADFIKSAAFSGADLYLTGDVKYHEAQLAEELDMALVDFGHYGSEKFVSSLLYERLNKLSDRKGLDKINYHKSEINTNPWQYW